MFNSAGISDSGAVSFFYAVGEVSPATVNECLAKKDLRKAPGHIYCFSHKVAKAPHYLCIVRYP